MKPVLLTVDDDRSVLNAVERDLRRHFASEYRIVKAGSGAEALEATRQLKQRGDEIALFLVDERMPEMSGTQFLIEAIRLYPKARKVLLTAYADTEAAITAINRIGLDQYLLKPWDPPDQRLYPVLDELLLDWFATAHPPFAGVRVAGTRLSRECYSIKDFLSSNHVPYQWLDIDRDASHREMVASATGDFSRLPVVFFPEGDFLVQPSPRELAARVGMQTRPDRPFYDFAIIGGGPAGLAAAVYGASEGLRTILLEAFAPGGQAGTSSHIENYLGFPSGITGSDLARRAATQARRFGAELLSAQGVTAIRREDPYRILTLSDGTELSCYALLVASGMEVRRLEAEGLEDLVGRGVYYGAAMSEASSVRGRHVIVVGGANSAGQGAMFFSQYADHVTMVVRGPDLGRTMSQYLIDRIENTSNVRVLPRTVVAGVVGSERLESVILRDLDGGEEREEVAGGLFIFIGTAPRTGMVSGLVNCDDQGFIVTGPDLLTNGKRPAGWNVDREPYLFETSVPGIFAAGDVRRGSGKRVAAAVGEGSATVSMVHTYLQTV